MPLSAAVPALTSGIKAAYDKARRQTPEYKQKKEAYDKARKAEKREKGRTILRNL